MSLLQKFEIYQRSTFFVKGLCFRRPRILSYAFSTIIYHSAVTVRSLTRCPGMVHFIHAAIYDLATETCGKTHFKVDLSFPGGTSQVCTGGPAPGRRCPAAAGRSCCAGSPAGRPGTFAPAPPPASAGTLHSSCTTARPSAYCSKQLTKLQVSEKHTTGGDAFPAVALTPCSAAPADRERCTGAAAGGGADDGLGYLVAATMW